MAAAPFRALPPGVYFNPTAEECVRDYVKPWAAGVPPPTDRVICDVDVYSDSPGALLLVREPGFSRGFDHKWLLLSHCRGGTAAGRGKRVVATGGSWQSEQTPKGVVGAADGEEDKQPRGGRRRSFGFYVGKNGRKRGEKTPWLMEEFTALEDGHGRGDGKTFVVFCRIYLSPRLEKEDKEKKRQILGDAMVAFDRNGKLKPVRVLVSPEFFDAAAQGQVPAPPRVLGHQQGQPPPPPAPPRVLGYQQDLLPPPPAPPLVLGHQQGQLPPPPAPPRVLGHQKGQPGAPPLLRFLGHQQAQPKAPTPAVLGDHHGGAMLPRAVPAHHDGQAMLPWGVPAHHHGHAAAAAAAPHQGFLGSRQGQTKLLHVLDPWEASPSFRLVDPQQGEAMAHTEKKPRLAYGSPAPQPRSSDSAPSSCVVHTAPAADDNQCSAEPAATTTLPPQEIPGTATAGTAKAEPKLADEAGKASAELMFDPSIYMNLVDFEPFTDYYVPGFDEFQLVDLLGGDV